MAIQVQQHPQGGYVCRCSQCGQSARLAHPSQFQGHRCVVRQTSQPADQYYGAGDIVAKATGALGIKPCAPCEKRKAMLNGMFPRVWRKP